MKPDLWRVVVVGTSCSGKTAYARQLSRLLKVPHVELDAIHWLPGWEPRPREAFRALVGNAAAGPVWVMDGNYGTVRNLLWPRATAAIWLNYSFSTIMARALRRTVKRAFTGEKLYAGNRETISIAFFSRHSILWWVATSYRRRIREYRELFDGASYPHLARIEFKSPRQAARSLEKRASTSGGAAGPESTR